jgi:hypothetical protein
MIENKHSKIPCGCPFKAVLCYFIIYEKSDQRRVNLCGACPAANTPLPDFSHFLRVQSLRLLSSQNKCTTSPGLAKLGNESHLCTFRKKTNTEMGK